MSIYERLGVRRVINADARLTRLGGSLMPQPVLDAMAAAAQQYVDLPELQLAVGRRIAELTDNAAAYVTNGASAGIFLATLACLQPDKHEVIFQRQQHFAYLPAVPLAGATLVEIGSEPELHPAELETAYTEHTAAVFYVAGAHMAAGALPLEEVIASAHARGVPVIVDAAAQLPPVANLWHFTRDLGADLAIFSGGKDLQGPQSSGLIVGREDLIARCYALGAPNHGPGRSMKVGKEELLGLLAAIEWYLELDEPARIAGFEQVVADWMAALNALPGVDAWREFPNEAGQPMPRCVVEVDPEVVGLTGPQLAAALWDSDPRIAVKTYGTTGISMTPDTLGPGDEHIITQRLQELLGATPD